MNHALEPSAKIASVSDTLYRRLKERVASSTAHTPLLAERKLADRYDVSHSTVRRVMDRLCEEGLVYKIQGRGCFVADAEPEGRTELRTVLYVDTEEITTGHPFFTRRLAGMLDACEPCGFRLQIVRLEDARASNNRLLLAELKRDEVAGVIVPWMSMGILAEVRQFNPQMQIVTSATRYPPPGVASVYPDYGALGYMAAEQVWKAGGREMSLVYHQHDSLAGARTFLPAGWQSGSALEVADFPISLKPDAGTLADQLAAAGHTAITFDDSIITLQVLAALEQHHPEFAARCTVLSHANYGDTALPATVTRLETDGYPFGVSLIETLNHLIGRGTVAPITNLIAPVLKLESDVP